MPLAKIESEGKNNQTFFCGETFDPKFPAMNTLAKTQKSKRLIPDTLPKSIGGHHTGNTHLCYHPLLTPYSLLPTLYSQIRPRSLHILFCIHVEC
jgi:hypothetical protein